MRKLTTFWMLIMLCMPLAMMGGNTKTTVTQVTDSVAVTDNVDYIISGDTPFTDDGKVNIVNTDHAVLIINKVKPSVAISKWLKKVLINGEQAKNSTNCQVKLYKNGCIILPYGNTFKPLTTFTERNFEGESCNNYGLGNTGGYMNTLTTALLNNRIRSFKHLLNQIFRGQVLPRAKLFVHTHPFHQIKKQLSSLKTKRASILSHRF